MSNSRVIRQRKKRFMLFILLTFFQLAHQQPHSHRSDLQVFIRDGFLYQPGMVVVTIEKQIQYRSEEHTSELQSLMRISYAVFCLKKKKTKQLYKRENRA